MSSRQELLHWFHGGINRVSLVAQIFREHWAPAKNAKRIRQAAQTDWVDRGTPAPSQGKNTSLLGKMFKPPNIFNLMRWPPGTLKSEMHVWNHMNSRQMLNTTTYDSLQIVCDSSWLIQNFSFGDWANFLGSHEEASKKGFPPCISLGEPS